MQIFCSSESEGISTKFKVKSDIKFSELYDKISKRFENWNFRVTYKDENSKHILIKGDKDLKNAIE